MGRFELALEATNPIVSPKIRFWHGLLIGLFLFALIIPLIDMIHKLDRTPLRSENRARAGLPGWPSSFREIPKAAEEFEAYFSDNFGFRDFLIRQYGIVKYFVFHESPSEMVVLGKDGWMFYTRQGNIESYRNVKPYTEAELDSFIQKIREREAWAQENGAQYIFMVGPDSHTLNSENMPDWATKVHPQSRFDQLVEHGKKYGVDILDVRPALFEEKKKAMIGVRSDTHWNVNGGYVAYREIVKRIQAMYPKVGDPIPRSDYEIVSFERESMDLGRVMGIQDLIKEKGQDLFYRGKRNYESTERQGLHFTTVNPTGEDFPIAVVGDSMSGNLVPHLGCQFAKVRYLWGYLFDTEEIKRYKPKVIIHLVIERTLMWDQVDNPPEVRDAFIRKMNRKKT